MKDIMKLADIYADRLHIDRKYHNEESSYDRDAARAALQSAIEALQADAKRYRFIKKYSRGDLYNHGVEFDWYAPNDDLDQQIDFAIDQQDPIKQLIETSQNLGLYDK